MNKAKEIISWMKANKKKSGAVAILLLALIVVGGIVLTTKANATNQDDDKKPVIIEKEEEEKEEVTEDEEVAESSSVSSGSTGYGATEIAGASQKKSSVKNNGNDERDVLIVETRVKNPTVYSKGSINADLFGVYVTKRGQDVTSTCTITVDSSAVVEGMSDVTINANCANGSASRRASVTLYIPKTSEQPVANSVSDNTHVATNGTSDATKSDDAQELVEIILIQDGVTRTFRKDSIENVYAHQTKKVYTYVPGNMTVDANGVTLAGRHFSEV